MQPSQIKKIARKPGASYGRGVALWGAHAPSRVRCGAPRNDRLLRGARPPRLHRRRGADVTFFIFDQDAGWCGQTSLASEAVVIDQDLTSTTVRSEGCELVVASSDADLIAQCRDGKPAAWDELFDKYYGVAARFVFQLSGEFSHEDTEEICQETFVAVVRNIQSFQARSSFQTWLLRIAANKAMDFRERARAAKRGGTAVHLSIHRDFSGDEPGVDPASESPGPDQLLQAGEAAQMLRDSLDRLGEPCREIIELRYYGDLSYGEIASELRLNPKTVSSRLSKCLDRLTAIAKEILPPEFHLPSNL